MAKRWKNWNEDLAQDLKNPEFAKEFIKAQLEEGLSLREALSETIRAYGVIEFAEACGINEANIHRAIKEGSNPTHKTLEALLKPFGMRLGALDEAS
jgi:DNA-binding phage protein